MLRTDLTFIKAFNVELLWLRQGKEKRGKHLAQKAQWTQLGIPKDSLKATAINESLLFDN